MLPLQNNPRKVMIGLFSKVNKVFSISIWREIYSDLLDLKIA
jgi:hypothetical protein